MERFAYEILFSTETPQGPVWQKASNGQQLGPNLFAILNQLGGLGWEMLGASDVVRSPRQEIFLKKRLP